MTRYLLDTDSFSEYLSEDTYPGSLAPISHRIASLDYGQVVLCAVTVAEVMRGMLNLLQRMEKINKDNVGYDAMLRADYAIHLFTILPYTDSAHEILSRFPPAIRRIGRPDCQIASIAIDTRCTVVTRNLRHFQEIPGVMCEDWTRSTPA